MIYPKNDGILIPTCSAMDFTIKFGPLPIYVNAPKKTAAIEIDFNINAESVNPSLANLKTSAMELMLAPCEAMPAARKFRYVGALSKNPDSKPVPQ